MKIEKPDENGWFAPGISEAISVLTAEAFSIQFIHKLGNCRAPLCIGIVLVDALFIGLFDRDHGIPGKVHEIGENFFCHFTDAIFDKPGILMGSKYDMALIAPF